MLDDLISDALGIERAPEEAAAPGDIPALNVSLV
jgi:hypothetical protein